MTPIPANQKHKEVRVLRSITKRDGREVPFDSSRIAQAIFKALVAVGEFKCVSGEPKEAKARRLADKLSNNVVLRLVQAFPQGVLGVEDIQDTVEKTLMSAGYLETAKSYILYRQDRTKKRDAKAAILDEFGQLLESTTTDNANVENSPSGKLLEIAQAAARQYYLARVIPERYSAAHKSGDFYIHDLAFYGITINCVQIPLGKLLANGFNNGGGKIRPPKRPASAGALAAIIMQSNQNDMYGGQSYGFFDRDMAPYFERASDEECFQAMEALIYNLNTMKCRAGAQVPFSSLNIGADTSPAGRKVTSNVLLAYEKGLGNGEQALFPNIIFRVMEGVNLNPGDPNYDLFKLAIRVAAKRLNPTFSFMDSSFNSPYGDQVGYMGCRTRVIANRRGPAVTDGRGNLSFSTINLPRLAIKAEGNLYRFFESLTNMVELTCEQLHHRYRLQAQLKAKDLPFTMKGIYLDSEKLRRDDAIEDVIKHGTLSVGFIGLAEALVALTGEHHGQSVEAQTLGDLVVRHLRKLCDEAAEHYDLNYTLIATPAEGLSGKFVEKDRASFGAIPGVTDRDYYTNSFHVPVHYPISAYDKIRIEGGYHKYTNAGHISYVELESSPANNLGAVEDLVRHMRACDMGYAGVNFPLDFCDDCGHIGLIDGRCPACGSSEISRVRRITGYLSELRRFNPAKASEAKSRQTCSL